MRRSITAFYRIKKLWVFIIFIIIYIFNRDLNYIHYYSA